MAHFNYNGFSEFGGLYIIWNSHTWRTYVGSCKRFRTRWKDGHVGSLLRNKHQNRFLQADFNKCKEILGNDDFLEFHVLEVMPESTREARLEAEEKWLKLAFDKGNQCYNLCNRAISREGHVSNTLEETSKLCSLASKRRWATKTQEERQENVLRLKTSRTPEIYQKVSAALLGRHYHTEETKAKMRLAKLGKCLTEEHKAKIGAKSKGNKHRFGIPHTQEAKDKISAHNKSHPNAGQFKKGQISHKGKKLLVK